MAIGLNPQHAEEFLLNGLPPEHFLMLAKEAVERLGWQLVYLSNTGLIARTNNPPKHYQVQVRISSDQAFVQSASISSELMDLGRNKKNTQLFIEMFEKLQSIRTSEELNINYEIIREFLPPAEADMLARPISTSRPFHIFQVFIPAKNYYITPVLLNINLLVYVLMAFAKVDPFSPDSMTLVNWGANSKVETLNGEWWRLFTNIFVHAGIVHLLVNMVTLVFSGFIVEPMVGRLRFLCAYMMTGILASLTSLWWHDDTVSVGASGAIFGVLGLLIALLITKVAAKENRGTVLFMVLFFVAHSIVSGLKENADHPAHIGGLISGVLVGFAFVPGMKKKESRSGRLVTTGIVSVLVFFITLFGYYSIPNDVAKYWDLMQQFTEAETAALQIYYQPETTPVDSQLAMLKYEGPKRWQRCVELLQESEQLDISPNLRERNKQIKRYCELQMEYNKLYYLTVADKTDQYNMRMKQIHVEIRQIIDIIHPPKETDDR